jgi:integrase
MPPKRRRTRGSGSLTLRGNVYWIEYQEGNRRLRESAHTGDPDAAAKYLQKRIGEVATTGDLAPAKVTISDLCKLVIADYELRALRSLPQVKWKIAAHIDRLIGKLPAARFGPAQIRLYAAARQREGVENGTINRELAMIRRAFTLGSREEPPLVRKVPYIATLEEAEPRSGFIEQHQYELLLATLPERFKALFVLGYHYGCRFGELRKLRWEQVDFEGAAIRLQAKQTKAKQPRVLPMYGDVRDWLERQREICAGELVFCYRKCANEVTKAGTAPVELPFGRHLEKNGWHEACATAGLPGLLFHDLRRSAVRNMERAGIPRSVAMKISGHKTESIYRRYDIVAEGDLQDAGAKLEEYGKKQAERAKLRRVK